MRLLWRNAGQRLERQIRKMEEKRGDGMRLKEDIDYRLLLERVGMCRGDVLLKTGQGDVLNLNSELSRCIVIFLMTKKELLKGAWVEPAKKEDAELLAEFFEE